MKLKITAVIAIPLSLFVGCALPSSRARLADKLVRPVPFEARGLAEASQFRPRVLVIRSKMDEGKVPTEWANKAEDEFWRSVERAGFSTLLKPSDIGINLRDFFDRGKLDVAKIQQTARDKSIPIVMEWELAPIQIHQDADPVGMVRQRRRQVVVQFKVKLVDTRKGAEIAKETGEGHHEDRDLLWLEKTDRKTTVADYDSMTLEFLVKQAVDDLLPKLMAHVQRVSWTGRVAMLKGDRVYLNVGRQSGVQVGDILKVLEVGDEVFDPETGDSIGKVPGRMKGTLEIISYFGQDGSVAVVHSGAGFQENDAVEYY
ncbi:MAG: hypothetical protein RJB66_2648 [Pseudomonadota bacterium]|jgi:hypothetical protein